MTFLKPIAPQLLSLLRFMSGLLVLQHGSAKYLNFPAGPMNNASPMTMSGAAGVIELIGGIAIFAPRFARARVRRGARNANAQAMLMLQCCNAASPVEINAA